jgi:acyl-CoA thioester hydrolase
MSRKPEPPIRDMFKVFRPVSTRWRDNDVYGHVNNVVYYEYFDSVVNGFLIEATATDIRQLPAIGLVVETGCVFFESVSFPEQLDVGLTVMHVGDSSVQYRLGVFKEGSTQAAAEGRFVHVYVDAQTRKKIAIPTIIRHALTRLL